MHPNDLVVNKKILITGAGGYIGPILAEYLSLSGFAVYGLDRSFKTPWSRQYLIGATYGDYSELHQTVPYDAVVHLGANSLLGPSMYRSHEYFENNVTGTQQFIKTLQRNGFTGLFINASSAAVYGNTLADSLPGRVAMGYFESDGKEPCNPYGHTKLMVEQLIDMLCSVTDLNAVSLRFFNVAGAGLYTGSSDELPHVITQLNKAAQSGQPFTINGDGSIARDYVSVLAVCDVIYTLICNFIWKNETFKDHEKFNVCTGIPTTINEVVSIYEKEADTKIKVVYGEERWGDPSVLVGNPNKLHDYFGDSVRKSSVTDIIRSVLKWNVTRGELYDYHS